MAALRVMAAQPGGTATIPRIKKELPTYLALSEEDRAPSQTRHGEEMWEQQVRNLVSHRATEGNIVAEGYATYQPRRLTITDAGRRRIA